MEGKQKREGERNIDREREWESLKEAKFYVAVRSARLANIRSWHSIDIYLRNIFLYKY